MSFLIVLFCTTGFYQFCCDGVYCPDCQLELNISTLGQNVTLKLPLNCVNTSFTATFNTERQPGNFTVKVLSQTFFFSVHAAACSKLTWYDHQHFRLGHPD